MEPAIMERKGRLEEVDHSFDIHYWQAQPPAANVKGLDVRELRLQRSVETFGRQQRADLAK